MIRRGEVYWVNLDPTIGAEIRKRRPAVVISNDVNNVHAETITVLPMTASVERVYPFEVLIARGVAGNSKACKVKANQIRTVDKRRLSGLMGALPSFLMNDVDAAVRLHLALD